MRSILVATTVLTRVPLPVIADHGDVGRAARWFPLVGGAIGGAGAFAAWGLRDVMAAPPALTAALLVGLAVWVTGAIHLDGLADMADGVGGGRTPADVLRIMRDPAVGSYGAIAITMVLLIKVTALATLLDDDAALPLLMAAPALSRWTIVALGTTLPYARAGGGLGEAVTHASSTSSLLIATSTAGAIAVATMGVDAWWCWTVVILVAAMVARSARCRIGGVTGDVFGASVELAEVAILAAGVLATRRLS